MGLETLAGLLVDQLY